MSDFRAQHPQFDYSLQLRVVSNVHNRVYHFHYTASLNGKAYPLNANHIQASVLFRIPTFPRTASNDHI